MPEIPVGRIAFRVSGHEYELSGPDICVQPPVSAAALVGAASKEGAKLERQRVRAKIEEMRSERLRNIPAFSNELSRAELQAKADAFGELLRWLDEGAP